MAFEQINRFEDGVALAMDRAIGQGRNRGCTGLLELPRCRIAVVFFLGIELLHQLLKIDASNRGIAWLEVGSRRVVGHRAEGQGQENEQRRG
jgi:hypothetical protein